MNFSNDYFARTFAAQKVMAILRGFDPDRTVELCHIAWDAGIDVVEVPVQSETAYPSLAAAIVAARKRGKSIGAGTVVTAAQVERVAVLGATYTVAPGTSEQVIRASAVVGLPHLPGVASASEITTVLEHGLTWAKAFPSVLLGPAWIAAQRGGPFPQVSFVATGGVDASNAAGFLAAGARVVGVGSALTDPDQLRLLGRL
jgi:2-dehydro-3-deoxyphosphogluconate aldolase/(4S)-4-hydroxy-2-oxoglutarate aldolase